MHFSTKIRDKLWSIHFVFKSKFLPKSCVGYTYHAWSDRKPRQIYLRLGYALKTELDTFCHELIHASLPDLDEDAVEETATAVATALLKRYEVTIRE